MSILEELSKDAIWEEYLLYKLDKKHLSKREEKQMIDFIQSKEYHKITDFLTDKGYTFKPPVKKTINKSGSRKKRIVYSYSYEESMVLKVMAYLLYQYDYKMSQNCYAFRRHYCAHTAILKLASIPQIDNLYCLKADISNYFNSIPAVSLCEEVKVILSDDRPLAEFLERLLLTDTAYEEEHIVKENRGAMAGIPISPFFANIYLNSLDKHYENRGIAYFRYSDDILILCQSEEEILMEKEFLESFLAQMGLELNQNKVTISKPGESIEFLGISYSKGILDLSEVTKKKLKAKIKRKANSLYRWRIEKNVDFEKTAKVMIRIFNKKFYDDTDEYAFTWSRWFFPILNTTDSLKEIDEYMQMYIRYISSGRHYKGNYRIRYDEMKKMGYRGLVNEYYKFAKK